MIFPKTEFNKASVKDADINKGLLVDLFNTIDEERLNIHSMLLLKDGSRVFRASAYDYDEDTKEEVYSVSKSFTSIAIGILFDLKLVALDDYVLFYFQDDVKEYLPEYESLKIRHLLTMTVGQETDLFMELTPNDNVFERFFNVPLVHQPGEVFKYNNHASLMLSGIVTKVTGRSLNDFLNEYLYSVIGMEKPIWNQVGNVNFGATGLQISANDMARFGLLLLNDGNWDGTQVVSKEYLDLATSLRVETKAISFQYDYDKYGYGYQFWMNSFGDYRCAGAYQQYIVINKEYHLVFVVKSYEERNVLRLFEEYILKAAKTGWNYCDYSLRDYTRRFKINSQEIIEKEKEIRFG